MSWKAKLSETGRSLPPAPKAVGLYVPAKRVGDLIYVSGQLPMKDGKLLSTGAVPSKVSTDDARLAAEQCVLNALAVAEQSGDLGGVVRLGCFVQSDDGFADQPAIANAASQLLLDLFGDAGRHVRAAVGVNALPLNASVEIEFVFSVA